MKDKLEWAILLATISQPFIQYFLEVIRDKRFEELKKEVKRERKELNNKLEEKEKRIENLEEKRMNYEKDKRVELRELLNNFKKLHIDNSKPMSLLHHRRMGEDFRSWDLNLEVEQENQYNEEFFERLKKEINRISLSDEDNSFVSRFNLETNEFIKWKEYKEVLNKSNSFFEYFKKLSNFENSSKKILFSLNRMNFLFSEMLS